jgi:ferritin-like metal-binding protein YciE
MAALLTLLENGIKEMYGVERSLLGPLEAAANKATNDQLRKVLLGHHKVTTKQVDRLEKAFKSLGKDASATKSSALDALLADLKAAGSPGSSAGDTVDLRIAQAALRIEHFELASYKFLVQIAVQARKNRIASQLEKNMGEEESAGSELEKMAEEIAVQS